MHIALTQHTWISHVHIALTSDGGVFCHSPDSELNNISSMFNDSDGIIMKHILSVVPIDLQQLITNLRVRDSESVCYPPSNISQ